MFVPATVAASGLGRLALLLVCLALVPPAALDLLQHAGAHHLSPKPAEDGLPLVLVHQDLHIVPLGCHHRRRREAERAHGGPSPWNFYDQLDLLVGPTLIGIKKSSPPRAALPVFQRGRRPRGGLGATHAGGIGA
jgi:hypothetical protein